MTYEELTVLANKYLNHVDTELIYYYINYFYVMINSSLIDKSKLEEYLIKANKYGNHLNYYDYNIECFTPKGYINNKYSGNINIRRTLSKNTKERTIYHEIHHIIQYDEKNNKTSFTLGFKNHLIVEACTEYVATFIYNEIHETTFIEKTYKSERVHLYSGGKVVSNYLSYQLLGNILTKLSLALDLDINFFIKETFDIENGIFNIRKKISEAIDKKLVDDKIKNNYLHPDYILYLLDLIYLGEKLISHGIVLDQEKTYIDEFNYKITISESILRESIENLDLLLYFLLEKNYDEFIKYVINKSTVKRIKDDIKKDSKILSIKRFFSTIE